MADRAGWDRRLLMVRHGRSEANAGLPSDDPRTVPLTVAGRRQAERVARLLGAAPGLVVASPMLRAAQTAAATVRRHPRVPYETWPVGEFSYLSGSPDLLRTPAGRRPLAAEYWRRADPDHCAGPGAESFRDLLARADAMLDRAAALDRSPVVVFTHQLFTQAVLWRVLLPDHPVDGSAMAAFRAWGTSWPIRNTGVVQLAFHEQLGVRLESVGEGGAGVEPP